MAVFMTLVGAVLLFFGVVFLHIGVILVSFIFFFLGWVARRMPAPPQQSGQTSAAPEDPRGKAALIIFLGVAFLLLIIFRGLNAIL